MKAHGLRVRLREATGNAILEAAETVASRDGLANANLQAVAAEAGIAVGTIYNYFDDKHELFSAVFARRRAELFAVIDDAVKHNAKAPFAVQLEVFVRTVFEHFDRRRAYLRLAVGRDFADLQLVKTKSAIKHPAMQQLQERALRVVKVGLRDKKLRNDDTAELIATVFVAILRGVLLMRADDDRLLAPDTARVVSLFLEGAGR
jgi:AcrR family transcriptional regulator